MEEHQCWHRILGWEAAPGQRSVESLGAQRLRYRGWSVLGVPLLFHGTLAFPALPSVELGRKARSSSSSPGAVEARQPRGRRAELGGRRCGAGGGEERPAAGGAGLSAPGAGRGAAPSPRPSPVRAVRSGRGAADKEPGPEPSGHRGQEGAARGRGRGGGGGQRHRGAEPGRGAAEPRAALAGNKRLLLPALSAVARGPRHHGRLRAPPRPGAAAAARPLQPERCPAPPAPVSTGEPAAASPGRAAGGEAALPGHGSGGGGSPAAEQSPQSARRGRGRSAALPACPRRCPSEERGERGTRRESSRALPAPAAPQSGPKLLSGSNYLRNPAAAVLGVAEGGVGRA